MNATSIISPMQMDPFEFWAARGRPVRRCGSSSSRFPLGSESDLEDWDSEPRLRVPASKSGWQCQPDLPALACQRRNRELSHNHARLQAARRRRRRPGQWALAAVMVAAGPQAH